MTTVGIVYESRHGATRGIAERVGEVLEREGLTAIVVAAERVSERATEIAEADAYVVGSGVYMGSWLKGATDFLADHATLLAGRPVWLFSSGPLPGSSAEKRSSGDPLEDALGPSDGPGSGGRKRIAELTAHVDVREHRIFTGAFDPTDPPRAMSERLVRMMPASKGLLPSGDFRDWPAIEAWACEIAAAMIGMPAPV